MADTRKPYVLKNTTMFVDGVEYGDGDVVELDPARGDELAELGVVEAQADPARHRRGRNAASDEA